MRAAELKSISGNAHVALRGVRIRARLGGMSQKTIVEQMFVNQENRAIEAVYTFPLPDGSAVCGFEVITGDRVLTGTIEETEKAIEKYEDAIEQGHGAFMVEADRPDVFTARVGNLKPRQSATIRLTYIAPLERVDKQIRVTFPTTIAPRYASSMGMDPLEALVEGDALNPPKALRVPYGLSLEVDIDLGKKIKAVTSPTHAIRVMEMDGTDAKSQASAAESLASSRPLRILLDGALTQMDRDIVIAIELAKEHEPSAQLATGTDGAPYLAVSFIPEFDVDDLANPAPSETIFVLDCSGSMMGASIQQATAALELCLRALSPGDTFNICRFGSTFEMMCSESMVYSQSTLLSALEYISRPADLGGTEIMAPLQAIFAAKPQAARVRNLVLLTDGQVTNEHAVIEMARKYSAQNRIFSFGIGSAASSFLVKGLARATRGAAEFITGAERIEDKVLRTFGRIASPIIRDIEIDWAGADVQTLAEIPPVFDGDVLTVFGRVAGSAPDSVMLNCVACDKPMSWRVEVPLSDDDDGVISTMWARRTIQSLEEVNNLRRYPKDTDEGRVCAEIVRLSKQFNLLSSVTTFIAIEHRNIEERNEGRPALRRVPVMLAAGFGGGVGGVSRGFAGAAAPMGVPHIGGAGAPYTLYQSDLPSDTVPPVAKPRARHFTRLRKLAPGGAAPGQSIDKAALAPDDLTAILSLQSADGWFEKEDTLFVRIVPLWHDWRDAITKSLPTLTTSSIAERDQVIRTVLFLLIFRERFADREAIWRRAAKKATRWIADQASVDSLVAQRWIEGIKIGK